MENFKWAFIGSGGIANLVSKELLLSETHDIVSVYSRTLANAEKFASSVGAKAYDNIADAVKDADAVYVCTINGAHFQNACDVIACGKPVFIEKPITDNSQKAEELFEIAKKANVYISEAMWTLHNGVACKVKQWLDDGEIGKIKHVTMNLQYNLLVFSAKKARLLDSTQGGGAMFDMGVYALAYAYNILGYPKKISYKARFKNGVDIGGKIRLTYDNHVVCDIKLAIDRFRQERAKIRGEHGCIILPAFHKANVGKLRAKKRETFRSPKNYFVEFDNVAKEVRAGLKTGNFVSKDATLNVMRMMEECLKSANKHKKI